MAKTAFHDKFSLNITGPGSVDSSSSNMGTNTIIVPANKRLIARVIIPTPSTYYLNNVTGGLFGSSTADTNISLPGFSYSISDMCILTPNMTISENATSVLTSNDLISPVLIFKPGTQIKIKLCQTMDPDQYMYSQSASGYSITNFAFINGFLEDDV